MQYKTLIILSALEMKVNKLAVDRDNLDVLNLELLHARKIQGSKFGTWIIRKLRFWACFKKLGLISGSGVGSYQLDQSDS